MKTLLLILLFFICIVGCNTSSSRSTYLSNESIEDKNEIELSTIVSPSLLCELKRITENPDTLGQGNKFDFKIVLVYFSETNNDCFVSVITSHFYDSEQLKGSIVLNGKMIAFYNPESSCNNNLVFSNKLNKEVRGNFPDEHSDIASNTSYDPHGKVFRIHNKDSLELVYSGFL